MPRANIDRTDVLSRLRRALVCLPLLALFLLALPAHAQTLEQVSFPSDDGTAITGWLQKPTGQGPFPAVVALHGCSGLWARSGKLGARHADWGDRLQAAGFVVLFPDSFRSRGLESVCTTPARTITPAGRARDAFGAAEWLARQPYVAKSRVGLLGWSNGGSTALHASRSGAKPATTDFRAVVAFYPGCSLILKNGWSARVPVTILHGAEDDWTPAAPCEALASAGGARFVSYPGAHHDFDHPDLPIRTRKVAYSVRGDGTVTIGTHAPSRADAISRVMGIFSAM